MDCTHRWTVTSPCPFCQGVELAALREENARLRTELLSGAPPYYRMWQDATRERGGEVVTPTEDYQRQIECQIEYWKEAARQAEDEATFLRGQYNEAEDRVAQAKADRNEAVEGAVSIGRESKKLEAEVSRLEGLILAWDGDGDSPTADALYVESRRIRAQREEGK